MRQGSRVKHRWFGEGVVIGTADAGTRLHVEFHAGARSWLSARQLVELAGPDNHGRNALQALQALQREAPLEAPSAEPTVPRVIQLEAPSAEPTVPQVIRLEAPSAELAVSEALPLESPSAEPTVPQVIQLEAPSAELAVSEALPLETPSPGPKSEFDPDRFASRRLIEALRLGIVPPDEIARFTFGRDREQAEMSDWLDHTDDNVRFIVGEYGSGKTHFLECMRALAIEKHYAVAEVSLDPGDAPLYRPKRVYRRLIQAFRYPDATNRLRGFREFVKDAAGRGHRLWDKDEFLRQLYGELRGGTLTDERWEWIEGNESLLWPRMHDESTASNIYCHLLSAISVIARDCLGLAGVVLLFDEAETVDQAASRLNVQRGLNLLRALQLVSANDPRLLTERFTWDGTSFQLGEGTGLRYSGRRSSLSYEPLRFSVAQPVALKTAFAFVPSDFLENEEISAEELYLEPLGEEALSNALRAALDEYSKAYEYVIPPSQWALLAHRLESLRASSPRQFVKAAIEAFDLARLCGYVDPDELLAV